MKIPDIRWILGGMMLAYAITLVIEIESMLTNQYFNSDITIRFAIVVLAFITSCVIVKKRRKNKKVV